MATSTLGSGTLVLAGTTSGTTTVTATAVAGTTTLTLPAATDTLVGKATTDTLTNKTLTTPSVSSPTISDGTINGVPYLNGSKVLTTGSALVFDGTNLTLGQTTSTAKLTVQSGVANGTVAQFGGSSGGSDPRGLTIKTFSSSGGGDCGVDFNAAINNTGYGSFKFSAGSATLASIDSSGNLMVGITSSSAIANKNIDVNGTGDAAFVVRVGGTTTSYLYSTAGTTILGTASSIPLAFNTNSAERGRFSADGTFRVKGAGTAGSTDAFQVSGSAPASAASLDSSGNLLVGTSTNANAYRQVLSFSGDTVGGLDFLDTFSSAGTTVAANFRRAGTSVGSITTTLSVTLYNTTSDQRLKENIVDAPDFGSVIDSLQVRSFDWKANGSHQRAGFVAQELVTVAPEAVHQPTDTDEMMAVDYSKLVPMLVKEIQSLRQRLSAANI